MTAVEGDWRGSGPLQFAYQWQTCNADGGDCAAIDGATGPTQTIDAQQLGTSLRVAVTASNNHGSATATSEAQSVELPSPQNAAAATITGRPGLGATLHATTGTWSPPADSYDYVWQRCVGASCTTIPASGNSATYRLSYLDLGKRIRVEVRADGDPWNASVSELTDAVYYLSSVYGEAIVGAPLVLHTYEDWSIRRQRCSASGGATCLDSDHGWGSSTYIPTRADLGFTIRAVLTRAREGRTEITEPSAVVVVATRPTNTTRPTIIGIPQPGESLDVDFGSWGGSPELDYRVSWQRCNSAGAGCDDIDGVDDRTQHVVHRADQGATLRAVVTVSNGWGSVSVDTPPTDIVAAASPLANIAPPQLYDSWWSPPSFGETFSDASHGFWSGDPDVVEQWQRCDPLTADADTDEMDCVDIAGATAADTSYTPQAADVGFRLRLRETASTPEDAQTLYTAATSSAVSAGDRGFTSVTFAGIPVVGQTLSAVSSYATDADLPLSTHYAFQRRDDNGTLTELQQGENPDYTLTAADLGHAIEIVIATSIWRADQATVVATDLANIITAGIEPLPSNDDAPSITGATTAGSLLTASSGGWHGGGGALDYAYQWRRCDAAGESCTEIDGATHDTYRLTAAELGATLRVRVSASNGGVSGDAVSDATATIETGTMPVNTSPPAISGTPRERELLTAHAGDWAGTQPMVHAYQWQACDDDGSGCHDIDGATDDELVLGSDQVTAGVRLRVIATNASGSGSAISEPTTAVESAPAPENTELPGLDILGRTSVGATATADAGLWVHVDASELQFQWQRCDATGANCADIADADGTSYDLAAVDVDSRLQVTVTATTPSGGASATSELSHTVAPAEPAAVEKMVNLSDDRRTLYLADADGGNEHVVVTCGELPGGEDCGLHRPKISPNGQMIAVTRDTGSGIAPDEDLLVMNYDGTAIRELGAGRDPAWSADGTEIVFTARDDAGSGTHLARAAASGRGGATPLADTPGQQQAPDISPDGTQLAYVDHDPARVTSGLHLANPDGTEPKRLNLGMEIRNAYNPQFSADGMQISFEASSLADPSERLRQVWLINRDGSGLHALPSAGETNETPSPGPGGTILVTRRTLTIVSYGYGVSYQYGDSYTWIIDPNAPNPTPIGGPARADASFHRASGFQDDACFVLGSLCEALQQIGQMEHDLQVLLVGAVCGDGGLCWKTASAFKLVRSGDRDRLPALVGQVIHDLCPLVAVVAVIKELANGHPLGAALNALGVIPLARAPKAGARIGRYLKQIRDTGSVGKITIIDVEGAF